MASVIISWGAPTTRASGKALKAGDIAGYTVEQSVDGGAFAKLTDNPADQVSRHVDNLDAGDYKFRVACFDTKNRTGGFSEASVTIEDETPPGLVLSLTIGVVGSLAAKAG